MNKKFLALLSAAAMMTTLMVGCGGNNDSQPSTGSTNEGGDAALTTVTPGTLTVSTNATFPPYEMTDDSGNVVGIDVDIANAIAEKLGLELEVIDMDFDASLLAVQNGKSEYLHGRPVHHARPRCCDGLFHQLCHRRAGGHRQGRL